MKKLFPLCFLLLLACTPEQKGVSINSNAIGGIVTQNYQATVAIQNSSGQTYCSGTLIDKDTVITAAHCLFNQSKLSNIKIAAGEKVVSIDNYHIHANYYPKSKLPVFIDYDLAYIKLNSPIILDNYPTLPLEEMDLFEDLLLVGYGNKFGKKEVTSLAVISNDDGLIIAGDQKHHSTKGDSGGSLYLVDKDQKLILAGITRSAHNAEDGSTIIASQFTSTELVDVWLKSMNLWEQGVDQLTKQKFNQAMSFFNRSLDISNNKNLDPMLELGFAHMMLNDYDNADLIFNKALTLNSKSIKARIYLATLYAAQESRGQMNSMIRKLKSQMINRTKKRHVEFILNALYENGNIGFNEFMTIQKMVFTNRF